MSVRRSEQLTTIVLALSVSTPIDVDGELTVLAGLIFVIAKCTVQSSQLTELIPFELILGFWN
jgi:hypothetical protein